MEDKIEKTVDIKAPVTRVWQALTNHTEFGEWFRVALESPFEIGNTSAGYITYPGYEHMRLEATVKAMETDKLFAFTWCPVPDDDETLSAEGMETLVEFKLEPIETGTRLTIIESGFSLLPDEVRRDAIRRNSEGWEAQTVNISTYVEA